jgi:hypothetical protein
MRTASESRYAIDSCRIDLIPSVALERLGLHNELCAIKWKDPTAWQRTGFPISPRIDSLKRHFESVRRYFAYTCHGCTCTCALSNSRTSTFEPCVQVWRGVRGSLNC